MSAYGARNPIQQPPHTAGETLTGLRTAIDPAQIPSPVEAIELDRQRCEGQTFDTLPGSYVPLSTSDFVALDQGNSSPRYIRPTTWNIPSTSKLASGCAMPLAVLVAPLADQDAREEPVPLVDLGEEGPPRCANVQCRAYINPWCRFVGGGGRWKCNLCTHETTVSSAYFSNLDANQFRLDHLQRPELNKGTVDFAVPSAYWAPHPPPRLDPPYFAPSSEPSPTAVPAFLNQTTSSTHAKSPSIQTSFNLSSLSQALNVIQQADDAQPGREPAPMDYVFVFDVSADAVRTGFLKASCDIVREMLYGERPSFPQTSRVAVIACDKALYFHNLSPRLQRAEVLVVPDVDEVFLPLRDGLFADPTESRHVLEDLLVSLPGWYELAPSTDSCLGSALRACQAALAGRGGHAVVFLASLPNTGVGALPPAPSEPDVLDTDREKTMYAPRDALWGRIGEQCAEEGIGVSVFLAPARFVDVGSIGTAVSLGGGEMFFHPRFDAVRDVPSMRSQLGRLLTRTTGYNCLMRVRCSTGLRMTSTLGHVHHTSPTDLALGTCTADRAYSFGFEHSGTLSSRENVYFQCALLYTSVQGQRRVRICNMALTVVELAGNVFRFADLDAVCAHIVRESVAKLPSQRILHIREDLTERCSSLLLGYKRKCAAATSPSQLILPEAFKSLPVHALGMLKSKPLKARNVSADVRNYWVHRLLSMDVRSTMQHLYPRMLALHDLDDSIALPHPETGEIMLPSLMRASYVYMEADGIYLIDNEETAIFWIGGSVSPQILKELFDVEEVFALNTRMTELPVLPTRLSTQVRNILSERRARRGGRESKLFFARQNLDGTEIEFADMLVEDQNNAAMSYIDYLRVVHKQINVALTSGGSIASPSSMRGTPW